MRKIKKDKTTRIKICPKCGSKKIINKITLTASLGLPQKIKCLDCGFESYGYAEETIKNK